MIAYFEKVELPAYEGFNYYLYTRNGDVIVFNISHQNHQGDWSHSFVLGNDLYTFIKNSLGYWAVASGRSMYRVPPRGTAFFLNGTPEQFPYFEESKKPKKIIRNLPDWF